MMNLDPLVEAKLASERPDVFWSIEVPHSAGTLYLADRAVYAGGKLFQSALQSIDDFQFLADASDKALDVPSLNVVVDSTRQLSPDNYRFPYYIDRLFQSRIVSCYLNVRTGIGHKRVRMWLGVPRRPISRGYDNATFRLVSAMELWLGKALCRTVARDDVHYPELRLADVGRALPLVLSSPTNVPITGVRAIMRRPRQASIPVPDPANSGDASLGRPTITAKAINETWTVEVIDDTIEAFTGAGDTNADIGGAERYIYAQPFTSPISFSSVTATVRLRYDAPHIPETGSNPFTIYALLFTNSGGVPGTLISLRNIGVFDHSGEYGDYEAAFSGFAAQPAGDYFVLVRHYGALQDSPPPISPGVYEGPFVDWHAKAGTGGGALRGTYSPTLDAVNIAGATYSGWTSYLNGTFLFSVSFPEIDDENTRFYSLTGTVSGNQGVGRTTLDHLAPSQRVVIPADAWAGIPEIGDVWTFTTPALPAQLVFAESAPTIYAAPAFGAQGFTFVDMAHGDVNPRFADGTPIGSYTAFSSAHDGFGYVAMIETMTEVTDDDEVLADLFTVQAHSGDSANPADVWTKVIRRAGLPEEYIDYTSYAASRVALAALNWTFAGMVNEAGRDAKSVLLAIAFQARSRFEWVRDKARFRFIPDTRPTDIVIPKSKVRLRSGTKVPNIRIDQVDAPRVVNVVNARYKRNWAIGKGADAYEKTLTRKDAISIAQFQSERTDDPAFLCDYITDDTVAGLFADFWLRRLALPPDTGFAELELDMVKIEPGDVVEFELPEG